MLKQIEVKVPGKLMILGEHAVIYGFPCIVTSVNRYLTVNISLSKNSDDFFLTYQNQDQSFLRDTVKLFKTKFKIRKSFFITTKSQISGYGLGSSSAVCVGVLKGLTKLFNITLSARELFNLAYQVVLNIQKKASGFDIASQIHGRTIYFDGKNKETEILTPWPMPLLVTYSGIKGDTQTMIEKVANLMKKQPKKIHKIMERIGELVKMARISIQDKDWLQLAMFFKENQKLLAELNISTPKIDLLIKTSLQNGALGAKLSGAGGGDCVIALVDAKSKTQVSSALNKVGGKILNIKTGVVGVIN